MTGGRAHKRDETLTIRNDDENKIDGDDDGLDCYGTLEEAIKQ